MGKRAEYHPFLSGPLTIILGNVLGGRDNPFVVDLTTPESERMVKQIEQMDKDEEMARKLQVLLLFPFSQ